MRKCPMHGGDVSLCEHLHREERPDAAPPKCNCYDFEPPPAGPGTFDPCPIHGFSKCDRAGDEGPAEVGYTYDIQQLHDAADPKGYPKDASGYPTRSSATSTEDAISPEVEPVAWRAKLKGNTGWVYYNVKPPTVFDTMTGSATRLTDIQPLYASPPRRGYRRRKRDPHRSD